MITVVNKRKHKPTPNDYYIGRGKESVLGNPFTHQPLENTKAQFQCKTREESIAKYSAYLDEKIREKDINICKALNDIFLLSQAGDVNLICWCKPASCHGDYIKELIDKKIKSKTT